MCQGRESYLFVIVIEGLPELPHRDVGQESRFAPWSIGLRILLAHHHGIDQVGLEVAAVVVRPVLRCPILVVSGSPAMPTLTASGILVTALIQRSTFQP